MNRLRLWILVTAVGCFASGMVIGWLVPGVVAGLRSDREEQDPEEALISRWVTDLGTDLGLSPEQERVIKMIFRAREEDESEAFRHSALEELPPSVRLQVKNARNKAEQRILKLLTEEQRRLYEELNSVNK